MQLARFVGVSGPATGFRVSLLRPNVNNNPTIYTAVIYIKQWLRGRGGTRMVWYTHNTYARGYMNKYYTICTTACITITKTFFFFFSYYIL